MKTTIECSDNLAFLHKLPDDSIKLVVTSPPYNIAKAYERKKLTLDAYVEGQSHVLQECVRVLHPEGSICWQV
ncbi:MAG: site-specific DNA-methyltransferase, partial [Candidatus Eremiobacteraeota bacterium]|nr:site-specific DNA-methyltransferase [Candidatus Eremiobacteraeota bacterium]